MAESYFTDSSTSRPRAVDRAARFAIVTGGIINLFNLSWVGQATNFLQTSWLGSALRYVGNGFSTPAPSAVQQGVSAVGGWAAALVAAGPTIQAVSEFARGNGRNGLAKIANGAARMGVVLVQAMFPTVALLAEGASLIFTGKFINTHFGEAAESMTASVIGTSGASRGRTQGVNVAAQQGMAPALQPQMGMPVMAQAPVMMAPQPVYYMPQPMMAQAPMMPAGMVPQMAVPAAAVAPVPAPMMVAAMPPAPQAVTQTSAPGQWTQLVTAQGRGPQVQAQQVRTLETAPPAAQGFVQSEAARRAAPQTGPVLG
jgi:hypothetical protein